MGLSEVFQWYLDDFGKGLRSTSDIWMTVGIV